MGYIIVAGLAFLLGILTTQAVIHIRKTKRESDET